jgi:uncharacterized protein (DUF952 family)
MNSCEIFHITNASDAGKLFSKGIYTTESLERKGCIHCSLRHQVKPVLEKLFSEHEDLVILKISTTGLGKKLVFENRPGEVELYPHVYGTIEVDDILEVIPFSKSEEGSWPEF